MGFSSSACLPLASVNSLTIIGFGRVVPLVEQWVGHRGHPCWLDWQTAPPSSCHPHCSSFGIGSHWDLHPGQLAPSSSGRQVGGRALAARTACQRPHLVVRHLLIFQIARKFRSLCPFIGCIVLDLPGLYSPNFSLANLGTHL